MRANVPERYFLRPTAYHWLAAQDRKLRNRDGKPDLGRIAEASNIHITTLYRIQAVPPGAEAMSGLVSLAIRSGASRRQAEHHLFDLVPVGSADDESVAA